MYHTDGKKACIHQYKSVGKRKGPNRKVHSGKNRLFRKETQMNKDTREGKKLCKGQPICTKTFLSKLERFFNTDFIKYC